MTRVIPQIVNTKTTLRAAVQALPDTVKVQALLGLDTTTVSSANTKSKDIPNLVRTMRKPLY